MSEASSILVFNCGSSSLKYALFDGEKALKRADVRLATPAPEAHAAAARGVLDELSSAGIRIDAVGHRAVHGGLARWAPSRLDEALFDDLEAAKPFAPLHLPAEIEVMRAVQSAHPDVPQIVCFDTAFHHDLPAIAARYPLPKELHERGLRRYGFHGLSYESALSVLEARGDGESERTVLAHLGGGSSLAAVRAGRCVDTTMGFSPTGGVLMATRTGDLDPGLLVHLLLREGFDAAGLDALVNRRGGLLALSETTGDMRDLIEKSASDPRALFAIEAYAQSIAKAIATMAVSLGGLDTLVFTGGIGAYSARARREITERVRFLGVEIEDEANRSNAFRINGSASAVLVNVVVADEEAVVALHTRKLLAETSVGA